MANGDYISKLVKGVRGEMEAIPTGLKPDQEPKQKSASRTLNPDIHDLLETIKKFEVNGNYKRLIRMDSRTEEVLKLLSPTFGVDVTSFVNFLCWDFLENNPELVNEIKQSIQKL